MAAVKKGKLIVLDGSDGSGKATQTKKLVTALRRNKMTVRTLDFPQYEKNLMGDFIGECLTGAHGDFLTLDPQITSVLYAADRFESSQKLQQWLDAGDTVILDRYVSANQIHQGGKIFDARKRKAFLLWLDRLEYEVFGLPRPDLTVYLDMPTESAQELLKGAQRKKIYATGKRKDLVEQSGEYLANARRSALWLAKTQKQWQRITCAERGAVRSIDDIHEDVLSVVQKKFR